MGLTDPALLTPIGVVEAPAGPATTSEACVVFEPLVLAGLDGLGPGTEVYLITWFDSARRNVLRVHARDDVSRPAQGVFSTRSPDRPNPIGLHRVTILDIDGRRVRVRNLEAADGTAVVDVKPAAPDQG